MYNISQNRLLIYNQFAFKLSKIQFNAIVISFMLLCFSMQLVSQQSGGGYAEPYIFRNVGARPNSMAGAFTAIGNDPYAIFYNPAGVGLIDGHSVTSNVSLLGLGRTQSSIAWVQNINDDFGFGIGINGINSGTFQARDIKGRPLGEMSDFQYAIYAATSYKIEFIKMGATLKYFANSLDGTPTAANGFALDVGTNIDVMGMFTVGIAVQNVSGMVFWNNLNKDREDIPYQVRAGIAMEIPLEQATTSSRSTVTGEMEEESVSSVRSILFSMDAILTQFQRSPDFVLGVEAIAHEMFVFRGGISLYGDYLGVPQILPMNYWGGGISIRPKIESFPFDLHIDYSISQNHLSENRISHHVSLLFGF